MSSGLGRGVHGVSSFRNQSPSRVHAPPIMIDLPASVSLKKTCIIVSRVGSRTPGGPFRHVTTLSLVGTDRPGTDRDSGKTICWSRSSFFLLCGVTLSSSLYSPVQVSADFRPGRAPPGLCPWPCARALHPHARVPGFHEEGGDSATGGDGDRSVAVRGAGAWLREGQGVRDLCTSRC
jgi:hypothetical protein